MPMWMSSLFNLLQYQMSWCNGYHSCFIFRKPRYKSLFRDWLSRWLSSPWFSSICPYNSRIRGKGQALLPIMSLGLLTGKQDQSFFDFDTRWTWVASIVSHLLFPWGKNLLDMVLLSLLSSSNTWYANKNWSLQKDLSYLKTWNKVKTLQGKQAATI
jgi:hypothetical protein